MPIHLFFPPRAAITEATTTTPSTWTIWRATTDWAATIMAASDRLSNLLMVTKLCYARLSFRPRCIVPPSRNTCNHCTLPRICLIYLGNVKGDPCQTMKKMWMYSFKGFRPFLVANPGYPPLTTPLTTLGYPAFVPTKTQSNDRLTGVSESDIGI